jgi:hypothetical protein
MDLIGQLQDAQKAAMRNKEKLKLGTIRMIMAAIKQKQVDERVDLTDDDVIAILTKMVKQRKDSQAQFEQAGRAELAEKEANEIQVIEAFLPQALSEDEVYSLITQAIEHSGASGMQDMGKVMAQLKPQITGRADMGKVSALVKSQLTQ